MDEDPITGVDTDDAHRPHQRIRAYGTMTWLSVLGLLAAAVLLDGLARVVGVAAALFFFAVAMSATGGATLDLEREERARQRLPQVDGHGQ